MTAANNFRDAPTKVILAVNSEIEASQVS